MDIAVSQTSDTLRFTLKGTVDEKGAQQIKEGFEKNYKTQFSTVIFDFGKVTHIGSAGIGKLLLIYKRAGVNNGRIIIENLDREVADLFTSLKLDSVFTLTRA